MSDADNESNRNGDTKVEVVRVGLLLEDKYVPAYAARALENMVEQTTGELSVAVFNESTTRVLENESSSVLEYLFQGVDLLRYHRFWAPYILKDRLFPPEWNENQDVTELSIYEDVERFECKPQPADDLGVELPDGIVDEVVDRADVLVRFGFGIINGRILTEPEYGVLSFHHGDIRKYRGRAGGFWAYVNGDDEAGVTLQQLEPTLDGGRIAVFESVDTTDARLFHEVRRKLHDVSETMIATAIKDIQTGEFDPQSPEELGDLYTERTASDVGRFLLREMRAVLRSG